jgi:hypothetical protein
LLRAPSLTRGDPIVGGRQYPVVRAGTGAHARTLCWACKGCTSSRGPPTRSAGPDHRIRRRPGWLPPLRPGRDRARPVGARGGQCALFRDARAGGGATGSGAAPNRHAGPGRSASSPRCTREPRSRPEPWGGLPTPSSTTTSPSRVDPRSRIATPTPRRPRRSASLTIKSETPLTDSGPYLLPTVESSAGLVSHQDRRSVLVNTHGKPSRIFGSRDR